MNQTEKGMSATDISTTLTDEELVLNAEEIFLELDRRETEDNWSNHASRS